MKNLLSICPSRIRPIQLKTMLDSYYINRSDGSDIVVYISTDDPMLCEYKEVLKDTPHIIGKRKYIVEVCNEIALENVDRYENFQIINDDHVIETKNFDIKLIDIIKKEGGGWGIACPFDRLTNWAQYQHPSAEIISSNIIKTLGYYIYPRLHHVGVDMYMGRIGIGINRLFRTMEVTIRHDHWNIGKALLDDNYRFVYSGEEFNYGNSIVAEYIVTQLSQDVTKLQEAMNAKV